MSDIRELQDEEEVGRATEILVDESYGLPDEVVREIEELLAGEKLKKVQKRVEMLHAADIADLLEALGRESRQLLVQLLGPSFDPETLAELDEAIRDEVIEILGPSNVAQALQVLDSDDAVEIFEDLDEDRKSEILIDLPASYRRILEESLSYPEDSAGRLMQRELVFIPAAWTVGETIDYMRTGEDLPDDFYDLFIVDPKHQPLGYVPLSRLLRTRRPVRVTEIMEADMRLVPLTMDQEEVAYMFRQYGLVSAAVVDEAGRLVGVITVDDVVDVIDEEAEEDFMKMAGVGDTDIFSALLDTTRSRFPWLVVNLLTAVLASMVIGLFEGTIEAVVALAILMPIVASMGGNAGTQTLTVAVRALAMKDLTSANAIRFIGKEFLIGTFNGVLFAILTGVLAWLWFGSPEIGGIIAAAMIITLMIAGLSGTLIPLGLERLKIDPAIASTVFLTTVTDVVGFFAFLGLAALLLL